MAKVHWYFDFISPFAYLQWQQLLPLHRSGRLHLSPKPILFAALLDHIGQLGPAEIPGKRAFTYRFVQWQAQQTGVQLRFPPAHPFNPMAALRLATAVSAREEEIAVIDALFRLIWAEGRLPDQAALQELAQAFELGELESLIGSAQVKAQLRESTEMAVRRGVYGVPSAELEGQLYWGNDATPMLLHALEQPDCWSRAPYAGLGQLPIGVSRKSPAAGAA